MIRPGDLVLYKRRGCDSYELGVAKRRSDRGGWFVYYSAGDTAAHTPDDCIFEFGNFAEGVVRAHLGGGETVA